MVSSHLEKIPPEVDGSSDRSDETFSVHSELMQISYFNCLGKNGVKRRLGVEPAPRGNVAPAT